MADNKAKIKISTKKVEDLMKSKAKYNPRRMSIKSKEGLRVSLEKFGYVDPIIWNNKTKTLISGHQRLDILHQQGFDEADVSVVNLSLKDEKKLNLLMNSETITGEFTREVNDILEEIFDDDIELFEFTNLNELYIDDGDDEDKTKKRLPEERLMAFAYEKYDCLLIVFRQKEDFKFITNKLGIDKPTVISSPSVENKKVGITRAVYAKRLIKVMEEDDLDIEDLDVDDI